MRIALLAVGRLRPAYRALCDEYLARIRRHAEIREVEVREAGRAGSAEVQRREEGKRLRAALPDRVVRVALAVDGRAWTSEEFAAQFRTWREASHDVAFLVGGAVGLDEALEDAAEVRWSLGPLTLPHELARVVVVEQVYRACTILQGTPYHKGARDAR